MIDSTERYQRSVQAAAVALADGDQLRAEHELQDAIKALTGAEGSELQLASALVRLGSLKQEMGSANEAIPLLARALALTEGRLDEDHPDLVILLNDLTRLYLKQGAHADAEPLLQRLLAIKRSKGEEHPEVATVLASLATVRQSLGRHEDAEQLWRRVLEIRQQTLAPNHFALATALEHLGETCAARAKLREAVRHFQRALAIRELTLGADHPSLRSSRERIADMQLQAEDSVDHEDAGAAPTGRLRLPMGDAFGTLLAARPSTSTVRQEPPRSKERPQVTLVRDHENASLPLPTALTMATAPQPPAEAVPYLNVLLDIKDELDETTEQPAPATATGSARMFASVNGFFQHRRAVAIAGVAVLTLPLAALAVTQARATRSTGWVEQTSLAQSVASPDTLASSGAVVSDLIGRPITSAGDVAKDSATSSGATTTGTSAPRPRPAETRSSVVRVVEEPLLPDILVPTLRPTVVRLDSVMSAINTPVPAIGDAFRVQLASSLRGAQSETLAGLGFVAPPQRARLIGALPTPRYPDQLSQRGVGGEVVVRFDVDTLGRPVMSSLTVVSSPHSLLTTAVRQVIPEMRFEPARTPAPESKRTFDAVEVGFQFRPTGEN